MLKKVDKPLVDDDYYTVYDFLKWSPKVVEALKQEIADIKSDIAEAEKASRSLLNKIVNKEIKSTEINQEVQKLMPKLNKVWMNDTFFLMAWLADNYSKNYSTFRKLMDKMKPTWFGLGASV